MDKFLEVEVPGQRMHAFVNFTAASKLSFAELCKFALLPGTYKSTCSPVAPNFGFLPI